MAKFKRGAAAAAAGNFKHIGDIRGKNFLGTSKEDLEGFTCFTHPIRLRCNFDSEKEKISLFFGDLVIPKDFPDSHIAAKLEYENHSADVPSLKLRFLLKWPFGEAEKKRKGEAWAEFKLTPCNVPIETDNWLTSIKHDTLTEQSSPETFIALAKKFDITTEDLKLAVRQPYTLSEMAFTFRGPQILSLNLLTEAHYGPLNETWIKFQELIATHTTITFEALFKCPDVAVETSMIKAAFSNCIPRAPQWVGKLQSKPEIKPKSKPMANPDQDNKLDLPEAGLGASKVAESGTGKENDIEAEAWAAGQDVWQEGNTVSPVLLTYPTIAKWWRKERVNPDRGSMLPKTSWPKSIPRYHFTYDNIAEFVTVNFYQLMQEDMELRAKCRPRDGVVRFANIPVIEGQKQFLMFLDLKTNPGSFEIGDEFELNVSGVTMKGRFITPVVFTPRNNLTALAKIHIKRTQVDEEDNESSPELDEMEEMEEEAMRNRIPQDAILDTMSCQTYEDVREKLLHLEGQRADITITTSLKPCKRMAAALKTVYEKAQSLTKGGPWDGWGQLPKDHMLQVFELVCANKPSLLPRFSMKDLFSKKVQESHAFEHAIRKAAETLDAEQKEALESITRPEGIPGGLQLVFGGAGTGKSRAALAIIEAIADVLSTNPKEHVPILVVTATNNQVNNLAIKIQSIGDRFNTESNKHPFIVVRAFPTYLEKMILDKRAGIPDKKSKRKESESDDTPTPDWIVIQELLQVLKDRKEHQSGFKDSRIQHEHLSLGIRVLEAAKCIDLKEGERNLLAPSDDSRFHNLRQYILKAQHEKEQENEGFSKKKLRQAIEGVERYVLGEKADVMVTTINGALAHSNYSRFPAKVILLDEGSLISEVELLGILGLYPHAKIRMITGDSYQLQPFSSVTAKDAIFRHEQATSPMTRLIATGSTQTQTITQHRCTKVINNCLNELAYQYLEMTDQYDLSFAEKEQRVGKIIAKLFNLPREMQMVLVETFGKTEPGMNQTSRLNRENVLTSLWIARELILKHNMSGDSIIIAVPYNAQKLLFEEVLGFYEKRIRTSGLECYKDDAARVEEFAKLRQKITTWGKVQGQQADFVILDCVITSGMGFLGSRNRWIAALSRAQFGMVVIASPSKVEEFYSEKRRKTEIGPRPEIDGEVEPVDMANFKMYTASPHGKLMKFIRKFCATLSKKDNESWDITSVWEKLPNKMSAFEIDHSKVRQPGGPEELDDWSGRNNPVDGGGSANTSWNISWNTSWND